MPYHRPNYDRNRTARAPGLLRIACALHCGAAVLCAGSFSNWAHRQELQLETSGLVKISLPADTLDHARADLADVRLADSEGIETPHLIERPRPVGPTNRSPLGFRATLEPDATVVLVETGTADTLEGVSLRTPATGFIKAVQVEGSQDTDHWSLLDAGLPLFRQAQGREEQLHLPLPPGSWRYLRLTIGDRGSAPVPFTGAQIHLASGEARSSEPLEVQFVGREEIPGESRLLLDLGAAHLPLAEIELIIPEPFFRRQVRLVSSQVEGITILEKELARGTIYRTISGDTPERVRLPLDLQIPGQELLLVIENADSPPIQIEEVRARRWPVHLAFWAGPPGRYTIYTGNPICRAPEYALPIREVDLDPTPVSFASLSKPTPNPDHVAAAAFSQVDELAGPLELIDWAFRKPVLVETAGVQQLELDLEVLANTQSEHADLRLMLGDRQVPYIIERRANYRAFKPKARISNDPDRSRVSRWLIQLPHSNLPVTRLECTSATTLFRRQLVLYEEPDDQRGGRYRRDLGRANWLQAPDHAASVFSIDLQGTPFTDQLYLETDNEDNPPLQLDAFELSYPMVRLLFRSSPAAAIFLYYDNARVGPPQYDLSLVAGQLVAADKVPAYLGAPEGLRAAFWGENQISGKGGVLFWGVLLVVVVGLLILIARLVPKPGDPAAPE